MGRVKDWEMEQEARGWWSVPGKFVCAECFDDDFLKQSIRDNVEVSKCDYCGSTGEELTGEDGTGGTACVLFFTREECGAPQTGEFAESKKQS